YEKAEGAFMQDAEISQSLLKKSKKKELAKDLLLTYIGLGKSLENQRKFQEAQNYYQKALKLKKHFTQSDLEELDKDIEEAEEALKRVASELSKPKEEAKKNSKKKGKRSKR
ncbi:MAG: tetratricopeptide repeat protein, partial [Bacteroidota bacterium]